MQEQSVDSWLEVAADLGIKGLEKCDQEKSEDCNKDLLKTGKKKRNMNVNEQDTCRINKQRAMKKKASCPEPELYNHTDILHESISNKEEDEKEDFVKLEDTKNIIDDRDHEQVVESETSSEEGEDLLLQDEMSLNTLALLDENKERTESGEKRNNFLEKQARRKKPF